MSDDHNWSNGKEQWADSKRKIVVKKHHAWKPTVSPEFADNFEAIFGKKRPTPAGTVAEPLPSEDVIAKAAFRANYDACFGGLHHRNVTIDECRDFDDAQPKAKR